MQAILVFAGRRLFTALLTIVAVCVLTLMLLDFVPGDPAVIIAGETATAQAQASIRSQLGLDAPLEDRIGKGLSALAHGDFGQSFYMKTPVGTLIWQRMRVTSALASLSLCVALVVGVTAGIATAWHNGGLLDRSWLFLASLGYSTPRLLHRVSSLLSVCRPFAVVAGTGHADGGGSASQPSTSGPPSHGRRLSDVLSAVEGHQSELH
jgi:ABC-type dipeptide/oligopeptide/nickel transport system permease component